MSEIIERPILFNADMTGGEYSWRSSDWEETEASEWNTRVYPEEVQAAIERDTTKRPDFIGDAFGVLVGKCPRCNYEVDHVCNKEICENCGQRLDWGEE